ncbi:hypothetical protein [Streptomyces sp. NPDC001500]
MDDQSIDDLVGRVRAEGLQSTGRGGLLPQLGKRPVQPAPGGEITLRSSA